MDPNGPCLFKPRNKKGDQIIAVSNLKKKHYRPLSTLESISNMILPYVNKKKYWTFRGEALVKTLMYQ
jgi:hypothetical protein